VHRFFVYILLYMVTLLNAGEVAVVEKPIEECNSDKIISKIYYLSSEKQEYTRGNLLEFWNAEDAYIGSTFHIKIYPQDKGLISGCTDPLDWSRYSDIAPFGGEEVVAFGADCVYHKPKDINKRMVEFHYILEYADINNHGREDVTKYYTIYDDNTTQMQEHEKKYENYFVTRPIKQFEAECLQVELRYCGDGIVDRLYGEECDPASNSFEASICDKKSCLIPMDYRLDFNFTDFNLTDFNITQ